LKGYFVTFEGIEGSGKTTQMERVSEELTARGIRHITTREPGGTPIGEAVRKILLDTANSNMDPRTELLLYGAARVQHVAQVIRPALEAGIHVLCDRFSDATEAYQGGGRGIDAPLIRSLNITDLIPDRTILLDMEPGEALARAVRRNQLANKSGPEGRFESEALEFHTRVRDRYLRLAADNPDRIVRIDASAPVEEVENRVREALQDLFPPKISPKSETP
jgi:dTMP kinase